MRKPPTLLAICALLAGALPVFAADLLPPDRPVEQVIDHYIDARLKQEGIVPAPQADDATLIRRLTLDLVGRIPTAAETKAFVESKDPAKRVKLVDRLMASPAFVRHQANQFEAMLAGDQRAGDGLRQYLKQALADNRSWSQMFRELVLPNEADPKQKGAGDFLRPRVKDLDRLTNDVSVLFFGVNVSCAQCHDHPLVADWKQDHFYGMKAFFSRTFDAGGFLGEREYGVVKFKPTKGPERQAKAMLLTGKVIDLPGMREPTADEQKKERDRLEKVKKDKVAPPPPAVSARAKLVELSLQAGQGDFFARSIANRLWHRMFGTGLVTPLDQMHSENPPTHPELLAWLARDAAAHNFDLRRTIRGIALSQAYSRSSRWKDDASPAPHLYAVARLKPLTPYQLATSLRLATTDPAQFPADLKPEEFEKRIEGAENAARGFASQIAAPTSDDYQIGVSEALLFSNSDRFAKEFLADGGDRLLNRLKQTTDPSAAVDLAVRAVLCRAPTPDETKLLGDYLRQRKDRHAEACRQVLWILLSSAEFRFNY